jgi:ATP-dependent DNA helicase RecG
MFEKISKIGPKTKERLNNLNIYNNDDLINHYPYRYNILEPTTLKENIEILINITITSVPIINYFGKKNVLRFQGMTEDNLIKFVIYNRGFIKSSLTIGKEVSVIGKYTKSNNTFVISDIRLEPIKSLQIEPIYRLTSGLTQNKIRGFINEALLNTNVIDYIPDYLVTKYKFNNKEDNLKLVHNPKTKEDINSSINRVKFEELFIFASKIELLKQNRKTENGIPKVIDKEKVNELIKSLPFKLTKDQISSIADIYNDLTSSKIMNRLLQGDVGSGKTIVAFISMYMNYLAGYQSALMAPTEVLAIQHYNNIKKLLDINIELLTGKLKPKERKEIINRLKNGELDIIIGTHALFSDEIEYNNLGLVITDEQHRFGVKERTKLKDKGIKPDILYMSATPIPRTYALTIYKDMEVSSIKTKPKDRVEIETNVVNNNKIKDVLQKTYEELKKGNKVYVIAPLIEEGETEKETINSLYHNYKKAFKNYNIGIIHGKLKNEEKEIVMNKFKEGIYQILIATTIIEVGIDDKDATVITIFNSEMYGLSTLHQLRGRVGRGNKKSYCFLITDKETKRLNILKETNDGFEIAEEDFKNRGSGDIFGIKQSGDMEFKQANLVRDFDIFKTVMKESETFIKEKIDMYPLIKEKITDNSKIDVINIK